MKVLFAIVLFSFLAVPAGAEELRVAVLSAEYPVQGEEMLIDLTPYLDTPTGQGWLACQPVSEMPEGLVLDKSCFLAGKSAESGEKVFDIRTFDGRVFKNVRIKLQVRAAELLIERGKIFTLDGFVPTAGLTVGKLVRVDATGRPFVKDLFSDMLVGNPTGENCLEPLGGIRVMLGNLALPVCVVTPTSVVAKMPETYGTLGYLRVVTTSGESNLLILPINGGRDFPGM